MRPGGRKMKKHLPEWFHAVTPYLVVRDAAAVIEFLEKAFDAERLVFHRLPGGRAHAMVRIGDSNVMIGQAPDHALESMFYLYVADVDAAYAKALKAGGVSIGEPSDKPYGDRSGGVKDPAG